MANNRTRVRGRQVVVVPTDGGLLPGDPCILGVLAGVSMNGKANPTNTAPQTIDTLGVYALPVKGINAGGNNAVASGDPIYYVVGDTPPLSKKVAGVPFGIALGPTALADSGYPAGQIVASGATTVIDIRLGSGS